MKKLNVNTERVLDQAVEEAKALGSTIVCPEHVLLAMTLESETTGCKALEMLGVDYDKLLDQLEGLVSFNEPITEIIPKASISLNHVLIVAEEISDKLGLDEIGTESILLAILDNNELIANRLIKSLSLDEKALETVLVGSGNTLFNNATNYEIKNSKVLEQFGRNLTAYAVQGRLDPLIGRDRELERTIQVLSRRTKNNPVFVGEAGVGKTVIAEGLAQRIVSGDVPKRFRGKTLYTLEMGALIAGAKYRGEAEGRIKEVIDEVAKRGDILLFIDEIHTLVGAGASSEGSLDIGNIIKPYLARGEFQIIGATTATEYRQTIEKDTALARRFQSIRVEETTEEETLEILKGIRSKYETHHEVKIADSALEACVKLSKRYITDRNLPDKAIDLMDEAASRVNMEIKEENIIKLENDLRKLRIEKENAVLDRDFAKASIIRNKENELKEELESLQAIHSITGEIKLVIPENIAQVVELWTGVPVTTMESDETEKLLNLENILGETVIGQKFAIKAVSKAIRRSRTGLKDPNRPMGVFLFAGPTGTGKTYVCQELAELQYGSRDNIIRLDMSEFMESHTVSKLIGAPSGYVGYQEGGKLVNEVRQHPYSLILLDEFEKAHPDVANIWLQVFDEGRLTDSHGNTADFRNCIIVMTSNVGSSAIAKEKVMGFGTSISKEDKEEKEYETLKDRTMKALKDGFRPEFINRIDEVVVFHSLTENDIVEIVRLETNKLLNRVRDLGFNIDIDNKALKLIADRGTNLEQGARPVKRAVQQELEDKLSEAILRKTVSKEKEVMISVEGEEIVFTEAIMTVE